LIDTLPQDQRGAFDGCVERISPRVISSSSSTAASRMSTTSYLSALTAGFGSDQSADEAPPHQRRKYRAPTIEFDFNTDLDFLVIPTQAPTARALPSQPSPASNKSVSSSITMSEINAVRSEIQAKFDADLQQFKTDLTERLEKDIAESVKTSVALALEGINAKMNTMLSVNNTIVYDNMKSERALITEATASAVSLRVDLAVSTAVARALKLVTRSRSPSRDRKKRSTPTKTDDEMVDAEAVK
jgi:hypothetical protein